MARPLSEVGKISEVGLRLGRTSALSRFAITSSSDRLMPSAAIVCCSEVCVPTRKGDVESHRSVCASADDIRVAGRYGT